MSKALRVDNTSPRLLIDVGISPPFHIPEEQVDLIEMFNDPLSGQKVAGLSASIHYRAKQNGNQESMVNVLG